MEFTKPFLVTSELFEEMVEAQRNYDFIINTIMDSMILDHGGKEETATSVAIAQNEMDKS